MEEKFGEKLVKALHYLFNKSWSWNLGDSRKNKISQENQAYSCFGSGS